MFDAHCYICNGLVPWKDILHDTNVEKKSDTEVAHSDCFWGENNYPESADLEESLKYGAQQNIFLDSSG